MITLATGETIQGIAGAATSITYTITGMEKAAAVETYKILAQGQLPAVVGVLYTAPASNVAFVKEILLHNPTAGSITFTLYVNGTAATNKIGTFILIAGGSAVYTQDGWKFFDGAGRLGVTVMPVSGVFTIINVQDYGAKGDSTTDDTVAIQAAITAAQAAMSARGVDVYFPPGIYKTTAALTVLGSNIILRGSGVGDSVLYPTHTTGDVIQFGNGSATLSAGGIQDMQIYCPSLRTTGATVNINKYHDFTMQDFSITNYFTGVLIQGASLKVSIRKGTINAGHVADGIGIQVNNGLGGDTYITDIVTSNDTGNKPLAGINIVVTGHTSLLRCNITSCVHGLYVNPGASQDVSYLFIDHCLFDSCGTNGAYFWASNATTARIRSVMCVNSWFSGSTSNPGYGINLLSAGTTAVIDALSFIGCRILNNYTHGVWFQAGAGLQNVSFTDCTIAGNSTGSSGASSGIYIAAAISSISVVNCKIGQAGTAANSQKYAIEVAAGASANLMFVGNDCQPNVTLGNNGYIQLGAITGGGIQIDKNVPSIPKLFGSGLNAATGAITTTEVIVSDATAARNRLSANALRVGTTLRCVIQGTCTVTSAPGTWIARLKMGTANAIGDTGIFVGPTVTSGAVGSSTFTIIIEIVVRGPLGASCAFYGYIRVLNSSATLGMLPTVTLQSVGTFATIASTAVNYVNASIIGSANVSIVAQTCSIEVVNP
jgi:hypothetical protein